MEKRLIRIFLIIFLLSTIAVTAVGQYHSSKNSGEKICVKSKSCAINYMNKLEEKDKNQ